MNNISSFENKQTMSSLEIAKLTGKRHSDVLIDIRKIFDEVDIRITDFSAVYLSEQNKELPCFNLPRRECDLVIAGYSAKYRLAIIDRWQELEAKQMPSMLDYAKALIESDEKLKESEKLRLEDKENNQALAQLMNLSNKEEDAQDNHWAACRILKLINK
jgi:phage regulator Rha-like protein